MSGDDLPRKGQRYWWRGITFIVTRVSVKGEWADIRSERSGWTKRQSLPLPPGSILIHEDSAL